MKCSAVLLHDIDPDRGETPLTSSHHHQHRAVVESASLFSVCSIPNPLSPGYFSANPHAWDWQVWMAASLFSSLSYFDLDRGPHVMLSDARICLSDCFALSPYFISRYHFNESTHQTVPIQFQQGWAKLFAAATVKLEGARASLPFFDVACFV